MSKKSRWNNGRAYRVHIRRARLHGAKGNKRERLLRAFSIALVVPGGMVVHPRGKEWRAGYSRITLAQWRHKHRKHLAWVASLEGQVPPPTERDSYHV